MTATKDERQPFVKITRFKWKTLIAIILTFFAGMYVCMVSSTIHNSFQNFCLGIMFAGITIFWCYLLSQGLYEDEILEVRGL